MKQTVRWLSTEEIEKLNGRVVQAIEREVRQVPYEFLVNGFPVTRYKEKNKYLCLLEVEE